MVICGVGYKLIIISGTVYHTCSVRSKINIINAGAAKTISSHIHKISFGK